MARDRRPATGVTSLCVRDVSAEGDCCACEMKVVDFWAFSTDKWGQEIMSMHHTRNALQYSTPKARRPL